VSCLRRENTNCLNAEQDADKRAPITVKFEIPYFTVSGIQVRYLKIVEKSGYQALPWVRYITQNGDDYRCVPIWSRCFLVADVIARSLRTAAEKGSAPIVPM
jgi:AP-1 complex subunit mu